MKTDKNIISDLPEKVEMLDYAALSRKQTVLYRKAVSDMEKRVLEAEGIERRGIVLGTITKLKQICNHPDQYLGQDDSFGCSCPDWALMCKHVAAALYGVGVRLDENPALFFELRGINMGKFIDVALENRVETMLANAKKPSSRIIDDNVNINQLFGVL